MLKYLVISLLTLLISTSVAYADTLHVKNQEVAFEGKHIEDDMKTVKFGVNFFERSGKTFKRFEIVIPKSDVSYEVTTVIADDTEETNIEKQIIEAGLWIYTSSPEKAYHKYWWAKRRIAEDEKNKIEVDDDVKTKVNSGILRFEIAGYVRSVGSLARNAKKLERVKEFSECFTVFKEFQEYLLLQTLQLANSYSVEIQNLMQIVLKIKRQEFFALISQKTPRRNADLIKHMQKLEDLYSEIKAIYRAPNSVKALTVLCEFLQMNKKKLEELLKNPDISKSTREYFETDKVKELIAASGNATLLSKINDLAVILFSDEGKNLKKLDERVKYYEELYKKLVNFDQVGKIVNADIFTFKAENSDKFKEGAESLSGIEKELYELMNALREDLGLNPLFVKAKTLKVASDNYVRELVKMETQSHTGKDLSTPKSRAKKAGWEGKHVGEVLYRGVQDNNKPMDALSHWFKSIGHLKTLVGKEFDSCGVSKSGFDWCILFGGP